MNRLPLMLMYHSVAPRGDDGITVAPERFEAQMTWLERRGLRGVSVAELLDASAHESERLVGLTFDDGYTDFVTEVLPALRRRGWSATVYLLATHTAEGRQSEAERGNPNPGQQLMTSAQARYAADAGFEIGSHGMHHESLPSVGDSELARDVEHSRTLLEACIDRPVRGFAYPYGHAGAREIAAVRSAGYDYACAIRPGELGGRHAIPRVYVGQRDERLRLRAKRARHRLASARWSC
jgi:peptidoglycan/xylan/chitin deacetylase (PgdA/CDA1 family)